MIAEGKITVDLGLTGERVGQVRLSSSRRIDACRSLLGQPVEQALASVPLLFSVCAEAQGLAAREACERAQGVDPDEAQHTARRLRILAEAIDNLSLQLGLAWPKLFEITAAVEAVRDVRQRTARLRAMAGSTAHSLESEASAQAAALRDQLTRLVGPSLPDGVAELEAWARGASMAQQAVAGLLRERLADFGRSGVPLLPRRSAAWFEGQLTANPAFENAPRFEGGPAEVGSLARHHDHPLVTSSLEVHGNGLLTRFVARLVDLTGMGAQIGALAQILRSPAPPVLGSKQDGQGCAVVETSRGPLAHLVRVEAGRVVDWRIAAPTEWNFGALGPLAAGLVGAEARGLHRHAELLVTALDPCVGFEIRVGEADA